MDFEAAAKEFDSVVKRLRDNSATVRVQIADLRDLQAQAGAAIVHCVRASVIPRPSGRQFWLSRALGEPDHESEMRLVAPTGLEVSSKSNRKVAQLSDDDREWFEMHRVAVIDACHAMQTRMEGIGDDCTAEQFMFRHVLLEASCWVMLPTEVTPRLKHIKSWRASLNTASEQDSPPPRENCVAEITFLSDWIENPDNESGRTAAIRSARMSAAICRALVSLCQRDKPPQDTSARQEIKCTLDERNGKGPRLEISLMRGPDENLSIHTISGKTEARLAHYVIQHPGQSHSWDALLRTGLEAGWWIAASPDSIRRAGRRLVTKLPPSLRGFWQQDSNGVIWLDS